MAASLKGLKQVNTGYQTGPLEDKRAGHERVLLSDKERQGSSAIFLARGGIKLGGMNSKLTVRKIK